MNNLVIVESPTKARSLSKYLGEKYQVEASMGHIRDLPKSELGIDIERNFEPKYIIPKDKTKRVNELKKIAREAQSLWLATDPDREGEAIAWHLKELVGKELSISGNNQKGKFANEKNNNNIHRVVFHEITEDAIKKAFEKPRDIDLKLVDAQQARRVLDRLVGYKLSPLLWKKVKSGLSAGRVQSVALRLIVEKEQEIKAFKSEEYWSVEAELESGVNSPAGGQQDLRFLATLIEKDGQKLEIKNKEEADLHVEALREAQYKVDKVTKKEVRKSPPPPFTTSTLQQAAANRLGFSAKKTMSLAQFLYEHGLITYMRTDSVTLSAQALTTIKSYIEQNIGKAYLSPTPRVYKAKTKLVQEAHEAIRPTNISLSADNLKNSEGITRDHVRLYDLIWKRTVACQMSDVIMDQTSVDIIASRKVDASCQLQNINLVSYLFRATGSVIKFNGWLKLYGKGQVSSRQPVDKYQEEGESAEEKILPELKEGETLKLIRLLPEQHFTEPPPRYTEASLIKKLEELGIGRPSTYAPIISTIMERYYVEKVERKFFPTELGVAVNEFLLKYFPEIVDYDFTAFLEDELDEIASGKREWKPTIKKFYDPFEAKLEKVGTEASKVKIVTEVIDKKCPECGKNLQIKFGKFGKFLACSGFPECKHTESLEEKLDIKCPDCGGDIVVRKTRRGKPFYGCKNWPGCKFASWTKPKEGKRGQIRVDSQIS